MPRSSKTPARGWPSQRGTRGGRHRGASLNYHSRPPTGSSVASSYRRFKTPSAEWHSGGAPGSQKTVRGRSYGRPVLQPATPLPVGHERTPQAQEQVNESQDHVIMALDLKSRGMLGCAYYVAREERLFCMEDSIGSGLESIEQCRCLQVTPLSSTDPAQ
jgi:DNA mismatch repair protein MSH5